MTAIDRTTLDRLIARGRAQGGLTTEDLRRDLPVDGMSADAIALVVIELEDAGVPVDLDESLLGLGGGVPSLMPAAADLPRRETPPPAGPPRDASATAAPRPAPSPASAPASSGPGAHRAVVLAGIAAVALALILLAVLRHGA
jgi:hypothetical protein